MKRSYLAVASVERPVGQQPDQEPRHQHRLVGVQLGLYEKVHHGEHRDGVDEAMKGMPAPRTQPADGSVRRGGSKRDQAGQSKGADRQIDAQDDLACHFQQIEMLVQDVERKMQDGIARRSDAERAPGESDAGIMEDALRGRDRQRDQEEPQRPIAGLMDGLGDGPSAKIVGRRLVGDPERRQHRRDEGDDLHRRPAPGSLAKKRPEIEAARLFAEHRYPQSGAIHCHARPGGTLNFYYRKAA